MIDEFITTRPRSEKLHLIITTRSSRKASDTVEGLELVIKGYGSFRTDLGPPAKDRVFIQSESVDLVNLLSIRALAQKLLASSLPRIDAVILNAGIWGVAGLNWPLAIYRVLTDFVHSVTFPDFHKSYRGAITPSQFPDLTPDAPKALLEAPPLASVFTSNTFGHYVLVHELMPLLRIPTSSGISPARIIWVSSLDASANMSLDDIQGFTADFAYDSSKRVTDLLALTASSHSSAQYVDHFLTPTTVRAGANSEPREDTEAAMQPPQILLCHPGILSSNIISLNIVLANLYTVALFIARFLGSPFHPVTPYAAAVAPVFLALASFDMITKMNSSSGPDGGGVGKWGSAALGWRGLPSVKRSFVPGYGGGGHVPNGADEWKQWGFGDEAKGISDSYSRFTGRRRNAKKPEQEDIDTFYQDGALAWRKMEDLRKEWMERCEIYEKWKKEKSL